MKFCLIKSKNRIVNLDQIVDAKFEEAYHQDAGVDEFNIPYPERDASAKLIITTTAVELGEASHYGGDVYGVASESQTIVVSGAEAEAIWKILESRAIIPHLELESK